MLKGASLGCWREPGGAFEEDAELDRLAGRHIDRLATLAKVDVADEDLARADGGGKRAERSRSHALAVDEDFRARRRVDDEAPERELHRCAS